MSGANITVDQAKLVLNSFAAIFQNNLTSAELVTWRKFDTEMNDRNALTVVEQVVPRYVVTHTVNGVQDLTSTDVQDSVFGSEQYKVQDIFGSSMGWGDFVKIRDVGAARESEALKSAALNLAEQIDAYILGYSVQASNNWLGTAGDPVSTYNDISSGYTRLKEEGVEDTDFRAVLSYYDRQALGANIINQTGVGSNTAGTAFSQGNASFGNQGDGIFRKGFSGSIDGIPTMFTQQLPTMTLGTRNATTSAVDGANQYSDYSAVAISSAPGNFMTQLINLTIGTGTETVQDGEVFTIANVFAYDNRLQAPLEHLQQFRVIGNFTAASGVATGVRIFPAMIVPGQSPSGSAADVLNVNTAHATVNSIPGATAALTWVGAVSAAVKPRVIMSKDAIQVSCADLIMPATGIGSRKALTKVPLSVRMWQNSVFNTGEHQVRFDVALSANVVDRRRIVRVNGSSGVDQ
jgi:P22 coat protein - gene protein 5